MNKSAFRQRYEKWKNGLKVYDAGKVIEKPNGPEEKQHEDAALRAALEYALAVKLDKFDSGKDAVAGGYDFNAIKQVSDEAPLSYGSYYDLTGDYKMDGIFASGSLAKYNTGKDDIIGTFVNKMSPIVYREIMQQGIKNPDRVHDYMMRQLAWESTYGTSNVAKKQRNYGGVGWNGKTYFTYKTDEDFVKNYVSLMNRRYKKALVADNIYGYGAALKEKGYYEDTLEHYTSNLANMKSLSKRVAAHRKSNPDLYTSRASVPATQEIEPTANIPTRNVEIPVSTNVVQPTVNATIMRRDIIDSLPYISEYKAQKPFVPVATPKLPTAIDLIENYNRFWNDDAPVLQMPR